MGEVVAFQGGGAVVDLESLAGGLSNIQQTSEPMASGDAILRLLRDGMWVYGQENIEVQPQALVAFNPTSICHGYIAWGEAEVLGEVMVPLNQSRPPRGSLPEVGANWDEQFQIDGLIMTGEDKGTPFVYKPTSLGGRRAFHTLLDKILIRIKESKPPVPMVELLTDHYMHKKFGKIYTPVLEVRKWASIGGDIEEPKAEAEPEAETKTESEAPKEAKGSRRRKRAPAA